MIIFENGSYQISPNYPDSNFLLGLDCEQPKWVVSDDSELAGKILSLASWEAVKDAEGNLIDVIEAELPVATLSDEVKINELKLQLNEIDRQAIRPLRAIAAGNDIEDDRKILRDLEEQAEAIRRQIAELEERESN